MGDTVPWMTAPSLGSGSACKPKGEFHIRWTGIMFVIRRGHWFSAFGLGWVARLVGSGVPTPQTPASRTVVRTLKGCNSQYVSQSPGIEFGKLEVVECVEVPRSNAKGGGLCLGGTVPMSGTVPTSGTDGHLWMCTALHSYCIVLNFAWS